MIRITRIEPTKYTTAVKKKKVAAYCRVSTNSAEQLSSLESQKAHYSEMIEKNTDWEFAGLYYDRGLSGTSMQKRDGLNSMLKDCRDGKIDLIITKSISRFARNAEDCLRTVRELYGLHIYIRFEKEGIDTETMDSEMILSVLSSVAADESRSISENVHWSVVKRFSDGTYNQGMAPYGYRNENGVLTIYEEEAKIIRYIFDETLKGSGGNVLAKALNERGIPAPRNGQWCGNTITAIIRNERYVGDALYQKTYNDINYKKRRNKGELEQFYSRDHHEPIVSRETFDAAQAMIERNRKLKSIDPESDKYQQRYSMSGKIICSECGGKLRRRTNFQDGQEPYVIWVCKTHLNDKESCSLKGIRNESIENAFVTMMNKLIFGYKQVLHPYIDSLRNLDRQASFTNIDELENKLEKNTVAGLKLKELYGKGYFDPALYAKEMVELASERERLEKEKKELSGKVANNSHFIEETRFLIQYAAMGTTLDAYCDELFVRFVDQVIVYSREFIGFRLKCGLTLRERISA